MWWDKQRLLQQSRKKLAEKSLKANHSTSVLPIPCNQEWNLIKVQTDTSSDTKHIRSILKLKSAFEKNSQNGLRFRSSNSILATLTAPCHSLQNICPFFFDFFPLKLGMKDFTDTTSCAGCKIPKPF